MVTEPIAIFQPSGALSHASGEVYLEQQTGAQEVMQVTIEARWTKTYLTAEDDPLLAALWDNDDDAIYDSM